MEYKGPIRRPTFEELLLRKPSTHSNPIGNRAYGLNLSQKKEIVFFSNRFYKKYEESTYHPRVDIITSLQLC